MLAVMFLRPITALAQDPAYVRGMAATCTACHGAESHGHAGIPGIAGRDKGDLLQQLKDFKSGARLATVMQQLANGFSVEQLELIAGYIASLKPVSAPIGR